MKADDNITIYDENWADWLDLQLYGPKIRWLRHLIFECLKQTDQGEIKSILDVGCGEGTTTYFIAKKFPNAIVDGIDFSETGIYNAKQRWHLPNLNFFHDLSSEHLNNKYDMLCSFEVLEHVEDWQELLNRFSDCSTRYIILAFPVGTMRPFEKSVGHLRNFQKAEVESCLQQNGFTPQQIFYAGYPFYSPIYRDLCNMFNAPGSSFARGKYGLSQKIVSQFFYILFRFLSTKRKYGEQFCGVFLKNKIFKP